MSYQNQIYANVHYGMDKTEKVAEKRDCNGYPGTILFIR